MKRLLDAWRRPARPGQAPTAPATEAFASLAEWQQARPAALARRDALHPPEEPVPAAAGDAGWPGRCGLCERSVVFALSPPVPGLPANLREQMACPHCGLSARHRVAMALLMQLPSIESARVYLTEQASASFLWLQSRVPGALGSEFGLGMARRLWLQAWFTRRGGRGLLAQRDVTALDFETASLDAIGSFDVLEHVPDYPAALGEFARCLRPGGRLVLTVPFFEASADTVVRARVLPDGKVEHLHLPEFHGDPVSGGVLCYYHFGWDLLQACRSAGFSDARWHHAWVPAEGLFGLWALVATR